MRATMTAILLCNLCSVPAVEALLSQSDCDGTPDASGQPEDARELAILACDGSLDATAGDFADWYSIEYGGAEWATFRFRADRGVNATLFSPDGNARVHLHQYFSYTFQVEGAGTWRLAIELAPANATPPRRQYEITTASAPGWTAPCDLANDAGNDFPSAQRIPRAGSCVGRYDTRTGDSQDWFKFDGYAGDVLTIYAQGGGGLRKFYPMVLAPDGTELGGWTRHEAVGSTFNNALDQNGEWRLYIGPIFGSECPDPHGCESSYRFALVAEAAASDLLATALREDRYLP